MDAPRHQVEDFTASAPYCSRTQILISRGALRLNSCATCKQQSQHDQSDGRARKVISQAPDVHWKPTSTSLPDMTGLPQQIPGVRQLQNCSGGLPFRNLGLGFVCVESKPYGVAANSFIEEVRDECELPDRGSDPGTCPPLEMDVTRSIHIGNGSARRALHGFVPGLSGR